MLASLQSNGTELHYLEKWRAVNLSDNSNWQSSSRILLPIVEAWGFSYFYTRRLGLQIRFPDNN
jgi:hypothetical protein